MDKGKTQTIFNYLKKNKYSERQTNAKYYILLIGRWCDLFINSRTETSNEQKAN